MSIAGTMAALAGAVVVLYALIKFHVYSLKKVWTPVFERQVEEPGEE